MGGFLEKIAETIHNLPKSIAQTVRHWIVRLYINDLRKKAATLQKMNPNLDLTALNLAIKALQIILSKAELGEEDMKGARKIRVQLLE